MVENGSDVKKILYELIKSDVKKILYELIKSDVKKILYELIESSVMGDDILRDSL